MCVNSFKCMSAQGELTLEKMVSNEGDLAIAKLSRHSKTMPKCRFNKTTHHPESFKSCERRRRRWGKFI